MSARAAAAAELQLRESKLRIPVERAGAIPRTVLVERLGASRRASVVLVRAPAGYGKTSAVAEWVRNERRPAAWYSIEAAENDPILFLTYVAAAVDLLVELPADLFGRLGSPGASPERLAEEIAAAFARLPEPVTLVLDDAHALTNAICWNAIGVLGDHMPPRSQLVVITRAAADLPLDRLRADGRVLDLGIDDLRMTDREAKELLAAAGAEVGDDDVAALTESTEGWPAGLYLAALARRASDGAVIAHAFGGADRNMSDYFRSEVLEPLSEREVALLTGTSVLDRMCAPLCDAMLEQPGSQEVLENLTATNLFVIPLDDDGRWFRVHHLFREMLREELDREDGDTAPLLGARAADWCEANGEGEAAIEYAHTAGDLTRVARLVEEAALPAYWNGRQATVMRWLSWLDDAERLEQHPALAVVGAWAHALGGRYETAERWARTAIRSTYDGPMPDGNSLEAWRANVKAAMCFDGIDAMRTDAEAAVALLEPGGWWAASSRILLGYAHLLSGDAARADVVFADTVEVAREIGATLGEATGLAQRSLLAAARGERGEAETLAAEARAATHRGRLDEYGPCAIVYTAVGRAALARGDRETATAELKTSERLAWQLTPALPWLAVQTRLELARAMLALGDLTAATRVLDDVDAVYAHRRHPGIAPELTAELRRELESRRVSDEGWEAALTSAELRLLPLLTTHLSFREVAERLQVSRNTIKTQAISAYRKLGVSSRSEAIDRARELGLL